MWPLTAGGRYRQVAASTGLTVFVHGSDQGHISVTFEVNFEIQL